MNHPEMGPVLLIPVLSRALDLEAYSIVKNQKQSSVEAFVAKVSDLIPQTQEAFVADVPKVLSQGHETLLLTLRVQAQESMVRTMVSKILIVYG